MVRFHTSMLMTSLLWSDSSLHYIWQICYGQIHRFATNDKFVMVRLLTSLSMTSLLWSDYSLRHDSGFSNKRFLSANWRIGMTASLARSRNKQGAAPPPPAYYPNKCGLSFRMERSGLRNLYFSVPIIFPQQMRFVIPNGAKRIEESLFFFRPIIFL